MLDVTIFMQFLHNLRLFISLSCNTDKLTLEANVICFFEKYSGNHVSGQ